MADREAYVTINRGNEAVLSLTIDLTIGTAADLITDGSKVGRVLSGASASAIGAQLWLESFDDDGLTIRDSVIVVGSGGIALLAAANGAPLFASAVIGLAASKALDATLQMAENYQGSEQFGVTVTNHNDDGSFEKFSHVAISSRKVNGEWVHTVGTTIREYEAQGTQKKTTLFTSPEAPRTQVVGSINEAFGIGSSDLPGVANPSECFLPGTPIRMADGSERPIEEVAAGDMVLSYDRNGDLVPGRVTRTYVNAVTQILDVHSLMMTPGHVTLCGDGPHAGRHVPVIDILRSDGALVTEDGRLLRAGTGCAVGSAGDAWLTTVIGTTEQDGRVRVAQVGRIRAGTRAILPAGQDVSVLELIARSGGTVTGDGDIVGADGVCRPFHWTFTDALPAPEDYVLARSATTLAEIDAAGERKDTWPVAAAMGPTARAAIPPRLASVNVPLALRDGGASGRMAPLGGAEGRFHKAGQVVH